MKLNFLMISSDQHRYDCLGVNGNRAIETPCLDRLAEQGINFTSAYTTCPVCTPARASFLNGQWSYNHGCGAYGAAVCAADGCAHGSAASARGGIPTGLYR